MIKKRIKNYLEADVFREEFAHTILHNVDVFAKFKKNRHEGGSGEACQGVSDDRNINSAEFAAKPVLFHPPSHLSAPQAQEDFADVYSAEM